MFLLALVLCLSSSFAGKLPAGVDDLDNVSLEEFLEDFGLDAVDDPEEAALMEEALKENEEIVKEANEAYANGDQTWYDEVNEFDDLPEDEFIAEHTGLLMNFTGFTRGMGLLNIPIPYDEASERYFDQFRNSRSNPPASYSAVTAGLVSPVKDQKQCGSCAAFATMALVETCFKKTTGVFGDYSEQHLLDCGYNYQGLNNGCQGAAPHGYAKFLVDKKPNMASEKDYPYKNTVGTCPTTYKTFFQGASITGGYWTEQGSEDTLKKLVHENGAVSTGVFVDMNFQNYKGGIFAGCGSGEPNHAVVVVGYGSENGVDYWLIKNSWGTSWGEKGYMRLKRGAKQCGIGGTIITLACGKTSGTTSATQAPTTTTTTTAASTTCKDMYDNCGDYQMFCDWIPGMKEFDCKKTCGGC